MNPNEKSKTEQFFESEANKLVEKAMNDEVAYGKISKRWNDLNNGYWSHYHWKNSHKVHYQELTGIMEALDEMIQDVIHLIAAFKFFCGGYELQINSLQDIVVSTKGYYHYIGA